MTKMLRPRQSKGAKAAGKTSAKNGAPPKPSKARRQAKSLAEFNRWMENHAELVMKVAKKNTLRLTGKELF